MGMCRAAPTDICQNTFLHCCCLRAPATIHKVKPMTQMIIVKPNGKLLVKQRALNWSSPHLRIRRTMQAARLFNRMSRGFTR